MAEESKQPETNAALLAGLPAAETRAKVSIILILSLYIRNYISYSNKHLPEFVLLTMYIVDFFTLHFMFIEWRFSRCNRRFIIYREENTSCKYSV